MVKSFQSNSAIVNPARDETMEAIEKLLQLHGYETADLIHQYYIERYHHQTQMSDAPFGMLTVKCGIIGDNLEVSAFSCISLHLIPHQLMKKKKTFLFSD